MKYLFIDTCSNRLIISIVNNMEMIYYFEEKNDTNLSTKIMPLLDIAFKKASFKVNDIDKIFIVNGPGSFTGIRVGVTIAKIIGSQLNIPLISLSELELMATTDTKEEFNIPIIDARRGYVYVAIYDKKLNKKMDEQHMLLADIIKSENHIFVDENNVKVDILKIIRKHENDQPVMPHLLMPNYLKKTEAEENLND